ncbi:hypothetical protein M8C13_32390 [Crossiella sp. SN42]|uniref:hypothetical protein n=1 Tax=Crossiella sp. SN42 TaxID=2944808 RepID=UPI00207C4607|nr:hypothetical protein [Crossiella sp. SN42]MCO1580463.1 hypothetical protein [Crossiella sp. SN42]
MDNIVCTRCGTRWNENYLKTKSIRSLEANQAHVLIPLNGMVDDLLGSAEVGADTGGRVHPWAQSTSPVTAAFNYWWQGAFADDSEPGRAAAKLVQTVVYRAVQRGKGCPDCGFAS